jgi:subfamily B ATP-binding cassette protein MsbA
VLSSLPTKRELKDRFRLYCRTLRFLTPYRWQVGISLVSTVSLAFLTVVNPVLAKLTIDVAFATRDYSLFLMIIGVAVGVMVITVLFQFIQNYLNARLDSLVRYDLNRHFYRHVLSLPLGFVEARPVGDITYRATADVNNVAGMVLTSLPTFLLSGLKVILFLSITLWLHWKLTLFSLLSFPLLFANNFLFTERIRSWQQNAQRAGSILLQAVNEDVIGLKLLKGFGKVRWELRRYVGFLNTATRLAFTTNMYKLLAGGTGSVLSALWYIALNCYAGYMVIRGELTLGALVAVAMYLAYLQEPLNRLMGIYQSTMIGLVSAGRLEEYLEVPREDVLLPSPSAPRGGTRGLRRFNGHVAFQGVHFAYLPGRPVLSDCSFRVEPGMTVGLVGPSGVGKTTVTKLLARFFDPQQGEVMLDGRDVRSIPLEGYRKQLGMVLQQPILFSGTVTDNILLGSAYGGNHRSMMPFIDHTVLGDILGRLPKGLETPVGPGGEFLSGGQKQIVAIARALIRDPALLILDEAVSFLDVETEELVVDLLKTLRKGRTTFVIAHRLSTIRDCDIIFVMANGQVAEAGSHRDLLKGNGFYRSMYRAQFRDWAEVVPKA